jgi:hypothetical protein
MLATVQRAKWSLALTAELLRLLDLFDRHSIPALPFKGPVLADQLYGDIAAREFCDLDILVRKQDILRAKFALLDAGYTTDLPHPPARQAAYLRARYEIHFRSPDGAVPIEIHQAFLPPSYGYFFDYDALWRRLQGRPFFGRQILAMAPEDLLLFLCAHGAKHSWNEPSLIRDVARLLSVSVDELRWPELLRHATAIGTRRILLLGILLAGSPVPPEILQEAQNDRTVTRLVARAGAPDHPSYFLRTRERLRDKLACCAGLALIPNEEDYTFLSLPAALSPLYYPLHAVRVAGKYARSCL